ncbi:hypothetical protein K438DRAFT_1589672 [Mycena galopus ATCC 62051]|nr:hypothetical protein K438DRAFT_1589672 [Mycena galopus ATCC 62051]
MPSKYGISHACSATEFNDTQEAQGSGLEYRFGGHSTHNYISKTKNLVRLCASAKSRVRLVHILSNISDSDNETEAGIEIQEENDIPHPRDQADLLQWLQLSDAHLDSLPTTTAPVCRGAYHSRKIGVDISERQCWRSIVQSEAMRLFFFQKLNFIEQCWGYAKRIYRMFPESSEEEELEQNMLKALDSVPLASMCRFAVRSSRLANAYFHGLDGADAAWANKKFCVILAHFDSSFFVQPKIEVGRDGILLHG